MQNVRARRGNIGKTTLGIPGSHFLCEKSLFHLLGVNLTKIESAPVIGKPFQYRFFLDFILHDKVSYQSTIEALTPLTIELKILGKYHPGKIDYT